MIKYPKIKTLYKREEQGQRKVIVDELSCPEFENIKRWRVSEKIDGTNIRVSLLPDGTVKIAGRTDEAQIYIPLMEKLLGLFTPNKMKAAFWKEGEEPFGAILFSEGYGTKIQKGGIYRPDVSFRLFDVFVGGLWLKETDVKDVAEKLGVKTVPFLESDIISLPETAQGLMHILPRSFVSSEEGGSDSTRPEGIVAREPHGLLMRNGDRLMWKLKFRDF